MAVANVDEPQYGGYEYEFVDKVPERLICSIICHKVLRDAHLLVCCGKHICETCLNGWFRSQDRLTCRQQKCPHCRQPNFMHVQNLSVRQEINELKIRCTNVKKGCTWEGALSNLKTHLESEKGCGFVEVPCTNKCKKQLKRKDLTDHLAQHCPLRKYNCQHCGQEDTYQTITEKHYGKCPSYPLDCPNTCGERGIKRAEMTQHRSICPLELIKCSNKCSKQLKRKDLADHLTQHCPLRKYKCQHCGQEDTYQTITEKHYDKCPSYPLDCPNTCGGRGIKRAKMRQHRSTCPQEPVECPFKEAGCQATLVRRELDSHMTANQQQHLLTLMTAFRMVKADFTAVKAEFSSAKEATKVMQEVIATDVAIIQRNEKQQSDLALASIKSQLEINSFRLQCYGPPLTVRMINFSHYQQSGKVWHSPPFYCEAGYKMQLAVYAKGTGAGASTHVSIALLLMKGELDDELEWPVPVNEICPSIVAQKSAVQRRVSHSIISAPNTASIDKLNFILCPKCTSAYHFQHDIVLEKEGVRELERKDRFVDHQTVNERLLNDSIVLKIQLTNHNHPVAMVPSHDRYATSTYRYGVQSARTEHTVSSSEYYVPSAGSYRQ